MLKRIWQAIVEMWQQKSLKAGWHSFLEANIIAGLSRAYANEACLAELPTINLDDNHTKYIIFSDQHRGGRNGADDFQASERAYNAALAYYFEMGYHLIALGDVEELWEERPSKVLKKYKHSLKLEAQFHEDGRYHRVFGNHDDIWKYGRLVNFYFRKYFGDKALTVFESLKIPVQKGEQAVGEFYLVHGHQGSIESDYLTHFSRLFVRYFWRYFQQITRKRLNTPATDWRKRKRTNEAMYNWAEAQKNLVLITGHTHYPVFESKTHEAQLVEALANAADPAERAALAAELEWVRAQGNQPTHADEAYPETEKSCYFNSGCCSFSDGKITGLEIADGHIRLIRWPDGTGEPNVKELTSAPLDEVLATVNPHFTVEKSASTAAVASLATNGHKHSTAA
ncbi:metallophosphoesterase [Candidatus Leptofilum sp.]|uniref:metallophosphoesterase n=1 Tax=Candidatus Leptofilum sp. TaxID=3241576 RepID=UPI003B5BE4B6